MRSALALALAWGGQFAFLFQAYWDARTKQPAILTLQHLKMMALATRTAGPPHVLLTLTATDFTELQTFTVLAEFGCSAGCTVDITGDGSVSANDILALLALYGQTCEE